MVNHETKPFLVETVYMALFSTNHVLISVERKMLKSDENLCVESLPCARHSPRYCSKRGKSAVRDQCLPSGSVNMTEKMHVPHGPWEGEISVQLAFVTGQLCREEKPGH